MMSPFRLFIQALTGKPQSLPVPLADDLEIFPLAKTRSDSSRFFFCHFEKGVDSSNFKYREQGNKQQIGKVCVAAPRGGEGE